MRSIFGETSLTDTCTYTCVVYVCSSLTLVYHYPLLFPLLLPLLIFSSHSPFLSSYSHTLILQSICLLYLLLPFSHHAMNSAGVLLYAFTSCLAWYDSTVEFDTHSEHVCWYVIHVAPPTMYMYNYCSIQYMCTCIYLIRHCGYYFFIC